MNKKLSLSREECHALKDKWDNMSDEDRLAYGCALIKVLKHLNSNLEDANKDPSYRRRERMRTKIALRSITSFIKQIRKNYAKIPREF